MGLYHDRHRKAVGVSPNAGEKLFSKRLPIPLVRTLHRHFRWLFMCGRSAVFRSLNARFDLLTVPYPACLGWRNTVAIQHPLE